MTHVIICNSIINRVRGLYLRPSFVICVIRNARFFHSLLFKTSLNYVFISDDGKCHLGIIEANRFIFFRERGTLIESRAPIDIHLARKILAEAGIAGNKVLHVSLSH